MKTKRNYTIEFYRIMFAINFHVIHVYMVFAMMINRGVPVLAWGLDVILPFMIFAGYFLMQGFKKQQRQAIECGITPGQQAWGYLKSRFLSLLPIFLTAQFLGFIVNQIAFDAPLHQWPIRLLNHIGELVGLQIAGIGFGGTFVGAWGTAPPPMILLNSPLWFISGLFVAGYIVYYLLAKCENAFIYFIGPVFALLFYGGRWITDSNPLWYNIYNIGDFFYTPGLPHMFVGLTIGCIIWVVVDKLRSKEFSRGMRGFVTVCSALLGIIIIYITWVPQNIEFWGTLFRFNWSVVHILTIFFALFVLWGADGFNRIFNRKIFALPGRLAFYIYMLHYPIIVTLGFAMGITTAMGDLHRLMIISLVATVVIAYLFMVLNNKVIQPWFAKKPWYSEKQRELEKEETVS